MVAAQAFAEVLTTTIFFGVAQNFHPVIPSYGASLKLGAQVQAGQSKPLPHTF